ncbi:hypothetical protein BS78_03G087900 [Paspalum vaginatum]|nr:hypothetical protein BS78_03G087900 [Paspalum vaginatum]
MDRDSSSDAHGRHRCAACFRQFNKMEHLVEHMRVARHSAHEPRCHVCHKHCRSFEALRDHLGVGGSSLPKAATCADAFAARGCAICLRVFPGGGAAAAHRAECRLSRTPPSSARLLRQPQPQRGGALALGCKMVGAGSDGTLDVCARVCVVDEGENLLLDTYVKPLIAVTHYRYETTGIRPEHLRGGSNCVSVKAAQQRVQDMLLNGEQPWKVRSSRGRARLLVGHGLDHDLAALAMDYPAYLKRDTATYPPLMKTSRLSNSLKFLTHTYLGYDIQTGHQHPYEDCVAAMRLYLRMRDQKHLPRRAGADDDADAPQQQATADQAFPAWRQRELERMTPEELLRLSTPDYRCWCLDE